MKLDKVGIDFLKSEEGCKLKPYLDSKGIPTIGYGNTYYEDGTPVTMKDKPITPERAESLFLIILKRFEDFITAIIIKSLTQNQFNALVSLVYNIGTTAFRGSTVLKLVNSNPNDPKIDSAIQMWKNAGGKPILLKRRIRESKLYYTK
jgi:lysozyme